jgi:hypothetical protein
VRGGKAITVLVLFGKLAFLGKRLTTEIIARVKRLSSHPLSGRVVPEFHVEHLREIIFPSFPYRRGPLMPPPKYSSKSLQ